MSTAIARPTEANFKPLAKCETMGEVFASKDFEERVRASLPRQINPDRMIRTFVMATMRDDNIRQCSVKSTVGALLMCAMTGLEPNTMLGQCYLIPFKVNKWNKATRQSEYVRTDLQWVPGYQGLLDLAYRSGQLSSVHCDVVNKGDIFEYEYGTGAKLRHIPQEGRETKPITHAYMHAQLKDGGQGFEVMLASEVMAVRNSSQGYRAAKAALDKANQNGWSPPAAYTEAPWVKHEAMMMRKTPVRRGTRYLPRSIEMALATAIEDRQDQVGPIDWGPMLEAKAGDMDPDQVPTLAGTLTSDEANPDERPSLHQVRTLDPVMRDEVDDYDTVKRATEDDAASQAAKRAAQAAATMAKARQDAEAKAAARAAEEAQAKAEAEDAKRWEAQRRADEAEAAADAAAARAAEAGSWDAPPNYDGPTENPELGMFAGPSSADDTPPAPVADPLPAEPTLRVTPRKVASEYFAAVKSSLEAIAPEQLPDWLAANSDVIAARGEATRTLIEGEIAKVRAKLPPPPPPVTNIGKNAAIVQDILAGLVERGITTKAAWRAWFEGSPALRVQIARLKESDPTLFDRFQADLAAKIA